MESNQVDGTQIAPSSYTSQSDSMQSLIPTKNMPALISYYCGVFGLIPILGLPASIGGVILGAIGLSKYNSSPTPGAKVHALIGLILGIVEIIIFTLLIILIIVSRGV